MEHAGVGQTTKTQFFVYSSGPKILTSLQILLPAWRHYQSSTHLLDRLLNFLLPVVELILELLRDLLQQLLWEDAQQSPSDVQGREDITILIGALCQKLRLKLVCELEVLVLVL